MRIDMVEHSIKVTAINPGMVDTEFSIVRFDGDKERAKSVYEGLVPLYAEDVAEAAKQCLRKGGGKFILMPGCEVPPDTPERNIRAFCLCDGCLIREELKC